jgi:hypothetical protein
MIFAPIFFSHQGLGETARAAAAVQSIEHSTLEMAKSRVRVRETKLRPRPNVIKLFMSVIY